MERTESSQPNTTEERLMELSAHRKALIGHIGVDDLAMTLGFGFQVAGRVVERKVASEAGKDVAAFLKLSGDAISVAGAVDGAWNISRLGVNLAETGWLHLKKKVGSLRYQLRVINEEMGNQTYDELEGGLER